MATRKQKAAARRNLKKARAKLRKHPSLRRHKRHGGRSRRHR